MHSLRNESGIAFSLVMSSDAVAQAENLKGTLSKDPNTDPLNQNEDPPASEELLLHLKHLKETLKSTRDDRDRKKSAWDEQQSKRVMLQNKIKEIREKSQLIQFIEDMQMRLQAIESERSIDQKESSDISPYGPRAIMWKGETNEFALANKLKRVRIYQLIGSGNYADVYRGILLPDNTDVAIKVLKKEYLEKSRDSSSSDLSRSSSEGEIVPPVVDEVQSFLSEINIQRSVYDKHIVNYYGHIKEPGILGIIMEYCSLGSLRDYISHNGPIRDEEVIRDILFATLSALKALLEKLIVHRDVKTGNVLMWNDGFKLCDFGCSTYVTSADTIIMDNKRKGTPAYMAPEAVVNRQRAKSDIWSLGCILFEVLAGEPPWKELEAQLSNSDAFLFNVMMKKSAPELPSGIYESLSPELQDFYKCCFTLAADKRPSAETLLHHPFITRPTRESDDSC